jgi:gas vesicle protein
MNKKPSCWSVGCLSLIGLWIFGGIVGFIAVPRDKNGKVIEHKKSAEEIKQEQKQKADMDKRLSVIRKICKDSGYDMEVNNSTISITVPGAISEYEAQRIAKSISDRTDHIVRVYDNAGLLRARL